MQPNNYLSNSHIGKIFLDSFNLIKGNVKFVAGCTLAFFIASIVYTFTLTPKYQIIADVKLKQDNSNSSFLVLPIKSGLTQSHYWRRWRKKLLGLL